MAQAVAEKRTLKLLLMGITGAGKSSTGNSLLGRKQFKVSGSFSSVTREVSCGYTELEDCILQVIDGPGLEDTGTEDLDGTAGAISNVGHAMSLCEGSVDAILLVIRFGERFTNDQKQAVQAMQHIIGKEGLQTFGIVVVTKKSKWIKDDSRRFPSLNTWCKDNDDKCGNIFSLCDYKCVLFENKKETNLEKQRAELLQCVQTIGAKGSYTNALFQQTEKDRLYYITQKKCLILKGTYQKDINMLYAKILKISETEVPDKKLEMYENINGRAKKILDEIKRDDQGSEHLRDLKDELEEIIKAVGQKNDHALLQLGENLEKLRKDRKGLVTSAVLRGIATVLTLGAAFPLLIRKLKQISAVDEKIDSHECNLKAHQ